MQTFSPGVPDFALHRVEAAGEGEERRIALAGPAIVLAERAGLRLRGAEGEAELARGTAVYVTPEEGSLTVSGDGIAWIATTGAPAASD